MVESFEEKTGRKYNKAVSGAAKDASFEGVETELKAGENTMCLTAIDSSGGNIDCLILD